MSWQDQFTDANGDWSGPNGYYVEPDGDPDGFKARAMGRIAPNHTYVVTEDEHGEATIQSWAERNGHNQ
jgi:hypothetical protein